MNNNFYNDDGNDYFIQNNQNQNNAYNNVASFDPFAPIELDENTGQPVTQNNTNPNYDLNSQQNSTYHTGQQNYVGQTSQNSNYADFQNLSQNSGTSGQYNTGIPNSGNNSLNNTYNQGPISNPNNEISSWDTNPPVNAYGNTQNFMNNNNTNINNSINQNNNFVDFSSQNTNNLPYNQHNPNVANSNGSGATEEYEVDRDEMFGDSPIKAPPYPYDPTTGKKIKSNIDPNDPNFYTGMENSNFNSNQLDDVDLYKTPEQQRMERYEKLEAMAFQYEQALRICGHGKWQWMLFAILGFGLMADGVEIFIAGFVLPAAEKDLCVTG